MNIKNNRVSSSYTNVVPTFLFLLMMVGLLVVPVEGTGKNPKKKVSPFSHYFFSFEDAQYYTSPDKRVGAKLLIDPAKVGPSIAAMQHLTFLPGGHIKSHRHVFVSEVIYVLKGNLTLRIGKQIKIMGPDTTAYIPPKTFHEYLNDSSDVCQFLQFFSPTGPEEEYRNWETPSDSAKTQAADSKPHKTEHVVAPPLPAVPGSPRPVLGTVIDTSSRNDRKQSFDLELRPMQSPSSSARSLELKTRLNDNKSY